MSVTGTASEVPYGGATLINCSTTCADPNATVGLETSLTKEEAARGRGWLAVRLSNVTEPSSDIVCFCSCFGHRKVSSFRMLAYGKCPPPRPAPAAERSLGTAGGSVASLGEALWPQRRWRPRCPPSVRSLSPPPPQSTAGPSTRTWGGWNGAGGGHEGARRLEQLRWGVLSLKCLGFWGGSASREGSGRP